MFFVGFVGLDATAQRLRPRRSIPPPTFRDTMTEGTQELDPLTSMAGEIESLKGEVTNLKGKLESQNKTANDLIKSNKILLAELSKRSAPSAPATAPTAPGDTVLDSFKKHIGINSNK